MPNPSLLAKMITTGILSLVAIVLYLLNTKSKARFLCMIAMLLCTLGDIFMTNIFKMNGMVSTVIGAGSFIAGHLFYSNMFYVLLKDKKGQLKNPGFYIGLAVGLIPLIVMEILAIIKVQDKQVLYMCAVPVYVAVITLHIACNFAYSWKLKSWRSIILAGAVMLFYYTDILIFLFMFGLCPAEVENPIWHFYPLAQLLIIVFSVPVIENLPKKNQ